MTTIIRKMIKQDYKLKICQDGDRYYFYKELKHRLNGPAIEYNNGDWTYMVHGVRHRLDGPATNWWGRLRYCVYGNVVDERDFYEHYYRKND